MKYISSSPVSLIEQFGDRVVVLESCTSKDELLLVLLHYYPSWRQMKALQADVHRMNNNTFRGIIKKLHDDRLIEKDDGECLLTIKGVRQAFEALNRLAPA